VALTIITRPIQVFPVTDTFRAHLSVIGRPACHEDFSQAIHAEMASHLVITVSDRDTEVEECTPEMAPSHAAPWELPSPEKRKPAGAEAAGREAHSQPSDVPWARTPGEDAVALPDADSAGDEVDSPPRSVKLPDADSAGDEVDSPPRSVKKMAWTPEEDTSLLAMVEHHGPASWSQIAQHLPGRVGKQCRERWHNHLSPDVKHLAFSEEEVCHAPLWAFRPPASDPPPTSPPPRQPAIPTHLASFPAPQDRLIMEAVAAHGTKWALIVKLIPGRTDNAIKNRWNSATRKLLRMQKRDGKPPGPEVCIYLSFICLSSPLPIYPSIHRDGWLAG